MVVKIDPMTFVRMHNGSMMAKRTIYIKDASNAMVPLVLWSTDAKISDWRADADVLLINNLKLCGDRNEPILTQTTTTRMELNADVHVVKDLVVHHWRMRIDSPPVQ
eukprot:TRINITY_DN4049_c0_g1_i2.p2 TRINITY_DN4049_c0_g1~~TRINITY_DN4049_c0_g1_i2.p2  ORF type:complete len:107 (-),score=21.37 TRINITY_DN4049_c0_g1_i2:3-323(-)